MKYFEWEKKYDVGIKKFNEQHQHLLGVLKEVYMSMENKEDRVALGKIINDLIKYAHVHFADEETCLVTNNYPEYAEHKNQHEFFMQKMKQFYHDFTSDKQLIHFEIAVFLKNWIVQHILVDDKKYGKFLNTKGIY